MTPATLPAVPRVPVPARRTATLIAVAVVLAALHLGRDILMPLALAVLVSFALVHPVARVEKLGLGRAWAVGLVSGALLLLLSCTGWLVGTQMKLVFEELPNHRASIQQKLSALSTRFAAMAAAGQNLVPDAEPTPRISLLDEQPIPASGMAGASPDEPLYVFPIEPGPSLLSQVQATLGTVLNPIGSAGMVLLFATYMLLKREDLRNRFIRLISNGNITGTTQALTDAGKRIGRYLGMQMLINVTSGMAAALGLYLLGVPGWALWGFLYSLLRFLPYVGPLLGASLPIAMALAVSPGWEMFVETVILLVVLEITINLVLEPWLYGGSTGISPFAVLVSAAVWTWLWGPIGLLLAMPLTVVVVVLGKSVPQFGFLHVLFGNDEVLSPADRYYQRVMANDPDEAIKILEEAAAADLPLPEIYETILVPGLTAAESARAGNKLTAEDYATVCDNIRDSLEATEERREMPTVANALTAASTETEAQTFGSGINLDGPHGGVVCLPAQDGACDVAAAVVCRLLQRAGHPCRALSSDLSLAERLDSIGDEEVMCIVSLPDPTLRRVRAMCKRVRSRRPGLKIVVMAWGSAVDPTVWRFRSLADCSDALATNCGDLTLAVARLQRAPRQPALVAAPVVAEATA